MSLSTAETAKLLKGIKIIDADTHLSEPHDLWTSRAPAGLKDRVPRIKMLNTGQLSWVIDDDKPIGGVGASPLSVIRKDGSKSRSLEFFDFKIEDVHEGAYDAKARLKVMDETGIFAQIAYPNVLGFGGQNAGLVDTELKIASIEIFNDAMAELQAESGNRIFPMALLPWWDVKQSVKETERCRKMGLRGVNINSDPHHAGDLPGLGDPHWDPLWEVCAGLSIPINFHIGASQTTLDWVGNAHWPSAPQGLGFVISSTMLFFGNARVMANIIMSGILDRHPTVKFVSVESGIGWIPFMLESLEYQLSENAASNRLALTPAEYFARNIYSTFWFERRFIEDTVRQVGVDNVMFETDFPHPTCLYPSPLEQALPGLARLDDASRRKVLSENAARLYSIPIT